MSAAQWETENVPASNEGARLGLYEALESQIEQEASALPDPARFRAAIARILSEAESLDVEPMAAALAYDALAKLIIAAQTFTRPEVVFDAVTCAIHRNQAFIADYARKHRMSRQSFHERIIRVSAVLGIRYKRIKPHKQRRNTL